MFDKNQMDNAISVVFEKLNKKNQFGVEGDGIEIVSECSGGSRYIIGE